MRLGQFARKYDVSQGEIIAYLKEIDPTQIELASNSKLDEETEKLLVQRFVPELEDHEGYKKEQNDQSIEVEQQETAAPEVSEAKGITLDLIEKEALLQNELDPTLPSIIAQDLQKKDEVIIETSELLELLDSEDPEVDLSKITHIKVAKQELSGLKVVGKIELEEEKPKKVDKREGSEKVLNPDKSTRRRLVSDEELEIRRIAAKEKKEEYQVRQEKRRIEKEKKQKQALKEANYKKNFQKNKSNQPKQKPKAQETETSIEVKKTRPKAKTFFGKFWRWLDATEKTQ